MVITSVAHWQLHFVGEVGYIGTHFAFYVDQTIGATVQKTCVFAYKKKIHEKVR